MKKAFFLVLFLLMTTNAHAYYNDGRTTHGPFVRFLMVEGRGFANLATGGLELGRTAVSEYRMHPHAWPVTYFPKLILNVAIRAISGLQDVLLYPWIVSFTDDLTPMTEPMGLSDYPWQWGAGKSD